MRSRASSASARSRVTRPSACPVVTAPSRLKAGRTRGRRRSPSSPSSNRSRRLAASALRNASRPAASSSAGRVHVRLQLTQSSPAPRPPSCSRPSEVRAARSVERAELALRPAEAELGSAVETAVFSKKTSCEQFGQAKARIAAPRQARGGSSSPSAAKPSSREVNGAPPPPARPRRSNDSELLRDRHTALATASGDAHRRDRAAPVTISSSFSVWPPTCRACPRSTPASPRSRADAAVPDEMELEVRPRRSRPAPRRCRLAALERLVTAFQEVDVGGRGRPVCRPPAFRPPARKPVTGSAAVSGSARSRRRGDRSLASGP